MSSRVSVGAVALAAALLLSIGAAAAGSWAVVDVQRAGVEAPSACVWTYWRGWHAAGRFGTWRGCMPGPAWRYERRCWIGPSNERHCRFYG